MASTEPVPGAVGASGAGIRALGGTDLPGCLELSRLAHWNQNEADWRMMLALGRGWGIDAPAGNGADGHALAASVVVVPYRFAHAPGAPAGAARGCAWISMVLVLPAFRRQGLATRLLRHAVDCLRTERLTPVLDATPAGYPVYLQEGFAAGWQFRRYRRESQPPPQARHAYRTRAVAEEDWPAIMAFDAPAFGADREQLLRTLARRLPSAARIASREGRITGFVFGRDGRQACQIGPLVAQDAPTAQELIDDALACTAGTEQAILVDLADRHIGLLEHLAAQGFRLERPFTRMTLQAQPPGDPQRVVLVAGPELG